MLIRYPGSKAKIANQIRKFFPDDINLPLWSRRATYAEPFFGAGAVGLGVLDNIWPKAQVHLNDKDYWLVCLWNAVWRTPDELIEHVQGFRPTSEQFYEFKSRDGEIGDDPCRLGFQKLALHQMSFSGLGAKSGGPLGGRQQMNGNGYSIDCRWNPDVLRVTIRRLHQLLNRFRFLRISCTDFGGVLNKLGDGDFAYLDPPYYVKGPELYSHAMTDEDHERLASILKSSAFRWVLSYDDCPQVRDLYSFATVRTINVTYTTATATTIKRPKNQEVVITP